MNPTKILALCDSPTLTTGFARVAQNLFQRWNKAGVLIDCWAIGFKGWRYKEVPYVNTLFPAGGGGEWGLPGNLELFLQQLLKGGYSHVWLMQDTFQLCRHGLADTLQKVCQEQGITSVLYFPVDAPLDATWTAMIGAVDVAVAYTEYGKAEALKALALRDGLEAPRIEVLPHGVDTKVYRPLPNRLEVRQQFWQGGKQAWVQDTDFLMVNVNANQRRKDVVRSLEILARLRADGVPAKLVMHMPERSYEGLSLVAVGEQLGLEHGKDWGHHGNYFAGSISSMSERDLVRLYNAADLYLTTSLGEGWGLGITEALACGCAVALPGHTSCQEIHDGLEVRGMFRTALLGLESGYVGLDQDNSRLRPRTCLPSAVRTIRRIAHRAEPGMDYQERPELTAEVEQWLSWDRIAKEFLRLMRVGRSPEVQPRMDTKGHEEENPGQPWLQGHTYYLEFGGGLGDVFNQLYHRGAYRVLRDLKAGESARVCLVSHNPFVKELFENHPKRAQFTVEDLGYWHTAEENRVQRAKHQMPPPGANALLPEVKGDGRMEFYPTDADWEALERLGLLGLRPLVVLAATAGLPERSLPEGLVRTVVAALVAAGCGVAVVGRDYERHGRREFHPEAGSPQVVDLVNQLSVAGTAELVQASAGLVTCHSALNILAWHERKPQLLLYPHSVWERHLQHRDQWAFGMDYPETLHADFADFQQHPEVLERFIARW